MGTQVVWLALHVGAWRSAVCGLDEPTVYGGAKLAPVQQSNALLSGVLPGAAELLRCRLTLEARVHAKRSASALGAGLVAALGVYLHALVGALQ